MNWTKKARNAAAVAAAAVAALAVFAVAAPEAGAATTPTSAGATLYNKVTVSYASGTVNLSASSSVSVTVTTLAARPTITVSSQAASILSGATQPYTYTIRSNSNGTDTYTVTASGTDTNMASVSTDSLTTTPIAPIVLWGGFAIGSGSDSGGDYITVPGGSTSASGVNPLALNSTLMLTVNGTANQTYSVKSITAGNPQSDSQATESYDKIYLVPVNNAVALSNVALGTQVGEYKTFSNTVTAGNVTITNTNTLDPDGTHVTQVTVVTAATDLNKAQLSYTTKSADSNTVTTTILAPKLSIVKDSRNVTANPASTFGSGTTARPGEVVEYRITITNLHSSSSAIISNANVIDSLPSYSTYSQGSTKISYNGGTVNPVTDAAGNTCPLAAPGYTLATPLAGGNTAVITYQTTVN